MDEQVRTNYTVRRTCTVLVGALLGVLTAVFVAPIAAHAATPTFVQVRATTPSTPQSSVAAAFASNEVAGHSNVVLVGWNDTTSNISTVTDSRGNAYSVALATSRGNGLSQAVYYASNVAAGADTVTVTFNQAAAFIDLRISEYANISTFDVGASATASTGSPANSGNVTTTNANDLLIGAGMTSGGFTGAGTGYTSRIITSDMDIQEDRNVTAAGTYSATAPKGGGTWLMQVVAFRATGGVAQPVANFTGTPLTGTAPLTVTFTDTSTNTPTAWSWTFGDGGTSTAQNPSHAYVAAGTYTVALTATNAGGSNTNTKTGYVTVTSGALINCWPAPAANCGFPDATNTGVPTGTTLSAYTGPTTITAANTVIDGKDVAACLTIVTTGVVIKNSHLHGNCFYVVYSHTGDSVTVQDSELDCANNVSTTALGDTAVTALRDNIHGCENGFDIDANVTVKDSYVHDLPSTDQAHTDGLQLSATLGQNVLVEHNTVTAKNDAGINGTSAMIMNTSGAVNVTLDNNLLDGGAFTVYCPTAADTNVQVFNNRFGRLAAFGQWTDCQDEARHDGNVYDNNNAPLT